MFKNPRTRVLLALSSLIILAAAVLAYLPQTPVAPSAKAVVTGLAPWLREPIRTLPSPTPGLIPPKIPSLVPRTELAPDIIPDLSGSPTIVHRVEPGESLGAITHRYLAQTMFMTSGELEAAIRAINPVLTGKHVRPDQEIIIPGIETAPIVERPAPVAKDAEVRAIYLTGWTAGSAHGLGLIRRWKGLGGNAVCFDVKDMDGLVNVSFDHPLAPRGRRPPIRSLPKFVRFLHRLGLHTIVRIALFRDEHIATRYPELAVQSRRATAPWRENGKQVWTDPSRREVQDYNIALAKHAASSGVDEIQFDYVRFPAEGNQQDAQFAFEGEPRGATRAKIITDFLERAYAELHPLGVLVSLDVFGVMAWQRPVDLARTGQKIVEMVRFCDVLSPMIYPSHFFGMDGFVRPGDAPEHFIGASMERFQQVTAASGVVLRPWLQAFGWRTKTYSADYVRTQVNVARQKGGIGYLFWNANNDYSGPFAAMPDLLKTAPPLQAQQRANQAPESVGGSGRAENVGGQQASGPETTSAASDGPPGEVSADF